jgi:hypothetical protein
MSKFAMMLATAGLHYIKPLVYRPGEGLRVGSSDFSDQEGEEIRYTMDTRPSDDPAFSILGTPVFADISLRTATTEINLGTALITVSRSKSIVQTVIPGLESSVKEYISAGDYNVRVNGMFAGASPLDFPAVETQDFNNMMNEAVALDVVSEYLNMLGIYQLVVSDFDMQQIEGYQNVNRYSFSAMSDQPVNLKLRDE